MKYQNSLCDLVKTIIELRRPDLSPEEIYAAKSLCVDVWNDLGKDEHIAVGRITKYLAVSNQIPLEPAGRTSSNWQLYRLK